MADPDLDLDAQLLAQMREDFLSESKDVLEGLGPLLAGLERGGDPELIHTIFRAMHTLKGTAAFVGLESMRRLAHSAENVFGAVRSGELSVDPELIDLTFSAVQSLSAMRDDVTHGGTGELDVEPLIARLEAAVQSAMPTEAGGASCPESILGLRAALGESDAPLVDSPQPVSLAEPASPETGAPRIVETVHGAADEQASEVSKTSEVSRTSEVSASVSETTLRVEVGALDTLMTLVGELVTARNALASTAERLGDETLLDNTVAIHRLTRQLQTAVSSVRLMPVERLFTRFVPVVRNLARERGKQVRLVIEGGETPLDRTVCDRMYDPLVHLLRNAVDHGLEPAEVRRVAGKPAEGVFRLSAERRGEDVYLRVSDDGAGIDPNRLRQVAVERGLLSAAEAHALTEDQALRLIFRTGFSTAASVTDLSGRGVGLDVVVDHVRSLRGHVDVETQPGRGTTFIIRLPLTLAILQVLLARVGEHVYALPLHALRETLRLSPGDVEMLHGRLATFVRERPLPLYHLADWLGVGRGPAESGSGVWQALVVRLTRGDEAWLVDELVGKQQVVVKPLSPYLGAVCGVEGAAILPNGAVTLVLDLEGLSRRDTGDPD